nr:MAG TPA: Metal binding domain of Ada [Caudoviricetes sp.]
MESIILSLVGIIIFLLCLLLYLHSNHDRPKSEKKLRQKRYTDRTTAPMAFHEFYAHVVLPLSLLYTIGHIILSAFAGTITAITIFYYLSLIPLVSCTLYFLNKYKAAGWYLNNILIVFAFAVNMFLLVFFLIDITADSVYYVVSASIRSVLFVFIFIYYYKRKGIFVPANDTKEESETKHTTSKNKAIFAVLILSVLCNIITIFYLVHLSNLYAFSQRAADEYYQAYEEEKALNMVTHQFPSYEELMQRAEEKKDNQYVVVTDPKTKLYHRAKCDDFPYQLMLEDSAFQAGYLPCESCCD